MKSYKSRYRETKNKANELQNQNIAGIHLIIGVSGILLRDVEHARWNLQHSFRISKSSGKSKYFSIKKLLMKKK